MTMALKNFSGINDQYHLKCMRNEIFLPVNFYPLAP